ncbi:hypothetical protein FBEOM_4193 [Fusarium beomiforme]|uniref:TNT domain-containing protein n=1 Tax=Fusarium beomiforme TaxID=44412 RepID=A0A9P5DYG7_9HYPO|nr:hypothetical protein FBEOM_4193 [Fusarium beomiforme]
MFLKSIFLSSLLATGLALYIPQEDITSKECDCSGDLVQKNKSLQNIYICGDERLGPTALPINLPLSTFVTGYDRFGGLSPNEFLEKWWDNTMRPDGKRPIGWKYPFKNGFELDDDERPIKANLVLKPGTLVDRFGEPTGRFISPATAPFSQRALHPGNLNTGKNQEFPNNYHVYNVTESITVQAGPIRPWFGQPGHGVQFFLGEGIRVQDYIDNKRYGDHDNRDTERPQKVEMQHQYWGRGTDDEALADDDSIIGKMYKQDTDMTEHWEYTSPEPL